LKKLDRIHGQTDRTVELGSTRRFPANIFEIGLTIDGWNHYARGVPKKATTNSADKSGQFTAVYTGRGWSPVFDDPQAAGGDAPRQAIPASDRYVEVDHNSATYHEAIAALDAVVKEVRESNAYRESDPDDQEIRLVQLEAGSRILRNCKRVGVAVVSTLLLAPLAWLADKFLDQTIGAKAEATIQAIKALFGL
jgi:hypothetical protein